MNKKVISDAADIILTHKYNYTANIMVLEKKLSWMRIFNYFLYFLNKKVFKPIDRFHEENWRCSCNKIYLDIDNPGG